MLVLRSNVCLIYSSFSLRFLFFISFYFIFLPFFPFTRFPDFFNSQTFLFHLISCKLRFLQLFLCLFIYFLCISLILSVCLFIHPRIHPLICPFTFSFPYASTQLSILPTAHPSLYLPFPSSIDLAVHLSTRLFTCSSIHPSHLHRQPFHSLIHAFIQW